MPEGRYNFNSEKFVQELAYLAKANLPGLSKLKVAKLFYFADKHHLLTYGRPILGDAYYCLDHGPVPSESLDLMNEAINPIVFDGHKSPFIRLFDKYLVVNRNPQYPEFVLKAEPSMDLFSKSEIQTLDTIISEFGTLSGWQLRQLSHGDPTWVIPDDGRPIGTRTDIPYELFFEGQSEKVRELLVLVEEDQEQARFADQLAR